MKEWDVRAVWAWSSLVRTRRLSLPAVGARRGGGLVRHSAKRDGGWAGTRRAGWCPASPDEEKT